MRWNHSKRGVSPPTDFVGRRPGYRVISSDRRLGDPRCPLGGNTLAGEWARRRQRVGSSSIVGAKTVFALADSGLPPPRLEIEITESVTHALGIETTAEGVENTALLMELPAHGCSSVQGYLFAEPTTLADVHRLFVEDNGVLQNVA